MRASRVSCSPPAGGFDAGGGAVLEHPLEYLLAVSHARRARRVVAVDLDQFDLVCVEAEQCLDVPLLVAALERLAVEPRACLDGHRNLLWLLDLTVRGLTWPLKCGSSQGPDPEMDDFPELTIGWCGPLDAASSLIAGDEGVRLLVMQFGEPS